MKELSKTYNPALTEEKIYRNWLENGYFKPKIDPNQEPFVVMMPPPNATGTLHLGHAIMLAIEDVLIRYHRMKGVPTLWLPGTDHAAIATQNKVEKLISEQGLTRQKLGREMFLDRVHKFVKESQATIRKQVMKMGSSCDWSRERYTLDDGLTNAVQSIFVKMYADGLIYRGYRIVNWCKRCTSTLADDEVNYLQSNARLFYIKYGPFTIATVRPETKFGDTAIAVNPDDKRYQEYLGKTVRVKDVLGEFDLKVIADKQVDPNFGTGALKVTPAHDATDFEMGKRHRLEVRQVIDESGKLNHLAGKYQGMTTEEARPKVVEDLKALGLLEKEESYQHNLAVCYRCATVIEPLISLQWFVSVDKPILADKSGKKKLSLKEKAIEVVKSEEIKIIPDRFNKTYYQWMENLHDWCISRQIWFGHRIPVWYCLDCYKLGESLGAKGSKGLMVSVAQPSACENCRGTKLVQDQDTLDTWFSSGLWTFSTLGWPEATEDLKYFHPTSVLETGYDILFFWVARMILMTEYALHQVPFHTIYLHGLVRDEKGRKMSKSLGNIIDPVDLIEKFGTDPVRLSLLIGTTPGNDVRLSEEKVSGYRNFVNKIWNVSRFILLKAQAVDYQDLPEVKTLADRYILSRFHHLIDLVSKKIEKFEFSAAGEALYHFTWNELADWYLEISKVEKNKEAILNHILVNLLKLWHPYTPFVTEEVWKNLEQKELLIGAAWPKAQAKYFNSEAEKDFSLIESLITGIRNLRQEKKIPAKNKINAVIYAGAKTALLKSQAEVISFLARIQDIKIQEKGPKVANAVAGVVGNVSFYISLDHAIDVEAESRRLDKEIEETERFIVTLETRLKNGDFSQKAPAEVVKECQERLKLSQDKLRELKTEKENLK